MRDLIRTNSKGHIKMNPITNKDQKTNNSPTTK